MTDRRRMRFLTNFALRHLSAFRILKRGQVLGRKDDPEIWRNVGEHCLIAGVFAWILAEEMALPAELARDVTRAAILHDWYKKHETLARKRARPGESLRELVEAIKDKDQRLLHALGIPARVVQLTGANQPVDGDGPRTQAERILWYVDAMLTDTEPVPIDQRFDNLEDHPTRGAANRAYSESYLFLVDGQSFTLYDMQRRLGGIVGETIARRIGYLGPLGDLPLFLKKLFWQRVEEVA